MVRRHRHKPDKTSKTPKPLKLLKPQNLLKPLSPQKLLKPHRRKAELPVPELYLNRELSMLAFN